MSKTYLKVKIKSLAEEAKIIRKEEHKAVKSARYHRLKQEENQTKLYEELKQGLYLHRIAPVGTESRAALIAYGYLRGLPYSRIETPKERNELSTNKFNSVKFGISVTEYYGLTQRVFTLINKYGDKKITHEEFENWLKGK